MTEDPTFLECLHKLNKKLKEDLIACQEMMKLLGIIEQVYTLATPPPKPLAEKKLLFSEEEKSEKNNVNVSRKTATDTNDKSDELETDNDVDFEIRETNTEILIDDDST